MTNQRGFTLIEMMIAVVIVAILASIAYPAYQDQVRKARRADALDALMYIQNLQEKFRANHPTYSTDFGEIGYGDTAVSNDGHYTLTLTDLDPANLAIGYVATATAAGGQASDTDCAAITITVNAANPRGLKAPATCWRQ